MTSTDAHVGDLLLDLLLTHAVDTVFGLPGGQTAALYDAIDRRRSWRSCRRCGTPRSKATGRR